MSTKKVTDAELRKIRDAYHAGLVGETVPVVQPVCPTCHNATNPGWCSDTWHKLMRGVVQQRAE